MTIEQQIHVQWERIENWLRAHHPGALQHLNGPANMTELAAAEMEIGMPFPAPLRASYLIHNGENGTAAVLPDGHWLLPVAECVQHWHWHKDVTNPRDDDLIENGPAWHNWVATGSTRIDGPVKPLSGSSRWIPITSMNGDILRYLDLNPAPGGTPGQVIEVDLECVTWRVLAPSFVDFLHGYADDLEQGRCTITEYGLQSADTRNQLPDPIVMPDYLRHIVIEPYELSSVVLPTLDTIKADQELILVGSMGILVGTHSQDIFSLHVDGIGEQRIVATAAITRGFSAIQVRQYARVRVIRYNGQFTPVDLGTAHESGIQWLALEYTPLR